jgi:hypothetical protein
LIKDNNFCVLLLRREGGGWGGGGGGRVCYVELISFQLGYWYILKYLQFEDFEERNIPNDKHFEIFMNILHLYCIPLLKGAQIFPKYRSHKKILDTRKVKWNTLHSENTPSPPKIRQHRTKYSLPGDLLPGIFYPFLTVSIYLVICPYLLWEKIIRFLCYDISSGRRLRGWRVANPSLPTQ